MDTLLKICALIPFYLLGAFPTGYLVARAKGVDITTHGSGNVGATNVARVIGKRAGALTLICDVLKGAIGATIAGMLSSDGNYVAMAAVALVAGHCFSIPTKLKGGKGVATALGVTLVLSWQVGVLTLAIFAAVFAALRIVSLASVSACVFGPVSAFLLNLPDQVSFPLAAIALIVVWRHKTNLVKLAEGTEKKMSFGKIDKNSQ